MADPVHIALVLKPEWRTPSGIARLRAIAATLGIEVTGAGEVAVSGTLSLALCQSLFGVNAAREQRQIPEPLRELVQSVSIIPGVRRV